MKGREKERRVFGRRDGTFVELQGSLFGGLSIVALVDFLHDVRLRLVFVLESWTEHCRWEVNLGFNVVKHRFGLEGVRERYSG